MSDGNYNHNQIKELLVGGTITEALIDEDPDDQTFAGFIVQNKDKTYAVWIARDPEQNGPGWLDVGDVTEALAKANG